MNEYKKINKRVAKKLIDKGYTVHVVACKVRPYNNMWIAPAEINKTKLSEYGVTFDQFINEFTFYNCNSELGYYPGYYLPEEVVL